MKLHLLLLAPSLATILIFMALPIALTTLYSVLTPAQYGGVIWEPSAEAYVRLLFERDIFDDSLTFNSDDLRILGRSVGQKSLWLMMVTVPYWLNLLVRTVALLLILRDRRPDQRRAASGGPDRWAVATGL